MNEAIKRAVTLLTEVQSVDSTLVGRLQAEVEPLRRDVDGGITDKQWYRFCDVLEACEQLNSALEQAKLAFGPHVFGPKHEHAWEPLTPESLARIDIQVHGLTNLKLVLGGQICIGCRTIK